MFNIVKRNKEFLTVPKAFTFVYLVYPLSIPLSKRLSERGVNPNHITLFSGISALISAYLFWQGTWLYLALGAIVFYLGIVLDQVDGSVARLTNQETDFGEKFDASMDSFRKLVCFVPLLYSQLYLRGNNKLLILGGVLLALHYSSHFTFNLLKRVDLPPSSFRNWLHEKGVRSSPFSKPDETFLIFIIGPLLNQFLLCFIISLVLFFVFSVLVKIKYLIKSKK